VSLERGKPVETLGYRLTYLGYKEIDSERYAFNVQVEHGSIKKIVSPLMRFNTQENATIRNPDIINFISRDFYVSPVTVQEGGQAQEVPLRLMKGATERIKGLEIEFQGFDFSGDQRAAMTEGKEFFISAKLWISDGKQKKDVELKMKSGPSGAEFIPTPFVSSDGQSYEFTIRQMMPSQDDPAKSAVEVNVKLPVDDSTPKKEETLVIEASVKPMINLVWAGTITLIIGFLLTISRRSEEAHRQGDKWEGE
jgi:cytochrome c-type biogenesis protein CcmF